MNHFEKASIGLALVLIGALVLIHHRQSTIDREAAHIIPNYLAKQASRMREDAMDEDRREQAAREFARYEYGDSRVTGYSPETGSNNVMLGYNALFDETTRPNEPWLGVKAGSYLCWPGWHEIPNQERDGLIVCGDGRGNVTATVKPKNP